MTHFHHGRWVREDLTPIDLSADPNAQTAHGSRHPATGYQAEEAPAEEAPAEEAPAAAPAPRKSSRRKDPRETVTGGTDPREGRSAQ